MMIRKELGQHFVNDKKFLKREVGYANIGQDETVLEIGPGIGNLTEILLKKAKKIIAIEKDLQFKEKLSKINGNLEIIWGDALTVKLPDFDRVISNLPFKIALPLIFRLLSKNFKIGVLLIQERLAVQIQRLAEVTILENVNRNKFYPKPNIDCSLVLIEKKRNTIKVKSDDYFKKVLDYLFFRRDKKLNYVLKELGVMKSISNKKIYELKLKAQKYASGRI